MPRQIPFGSPAVLPVDQLSRGIGPLARGWNPAGPSLFPILGYRLMKRGGHCDGKSSRERISRTSKLPLRCSDVMSDRPNSRPNSAWRERNNLPDPRSKRQSSTRGNIHRMSSAGKTRAVGASLGICKPPPISQHSWWLGRAGMAGVSWGEARMMISRRL